MTSTPPEARSARPRSSWRIFAPTAAFAVLVAVYSVYWYMAAGRMRATIEEFAASPAGNVAVAWNSLSISGYPYRFEASFAAPSIRAPLAPEAWEWSAAGLEADFLPYNFRHVVLKIDGEQVLKYRDVGGIAPRHHIWHIASRGSWASYVAIKDAPIGRIAIDIDDLVARHDGDGRADKLRIAADRLQLHAQPAEPDNGASAAANRPELANYDVALQGNDVTVGNAEASAVLGDRIALFGAQMRLKNLPRSVHASAVEISRQWLAEGGKLAVSDLAIKWGPLDLWAQGEVTLDAGMRPEGRFDAAIADYSKLIGALVKARVVSERDGRLALVGMGLVAQLQNDKSGRVHVPVIMKDGKLFLGPMMIARLEPLF